MRPHRRSLSLIVTLGLAAVLVPGLTHGAAAPATGSFTVVDSSFIAAGGGSTVQIAPGGTVGFTHAASALPHNVVFDSRQPQACTQLSPAPTGPVPPLPATASDQAWSGTCTFRDVGDYTFYCAVHPVDMKGTVRVVASGAPPPPPPPPPAGALGPAASDLKLNKSQRGRSVRGSIHVARRGSRLDVRALVRRRALGERKTAKRRVGRFLRTSVGGARVSFRVSLSKKARRALSRRGKLRITVEIAVTPLAGEKFAAKKTVTVRRPG